MTEYTLTLKPSGTSRSFPRDTILADALMDMGVMVRTPCGGKGTCGKCQVLLEGPVNDLSGKKSLSAGMHLACRTSIAGDVAVFIDQQQDTEGRTYPRVEPTAVYGIAVDIGTTSVKLSLVDCTHSRTYELDSFLNPQRRWGHDVISRIAASADRAVAGRLTAQIRQSVFSSIQRFLDGAGLPVERIDRIVLTGNTTMLYLFLGLDVDPLGRAPYVAATKDFIPYSAREAGGERFARTTISALPVHSAFLGADLVGGLASCSKKGLAGSTFFADLGTNGEMFLMDPAGRIFATSCAMGPALEGMNISWGMTAESGAITRISLEKGHLAYRMIGEGEPAGITGTALVDILAIMLRENIIRKDGAFNADLEDMSLPSPMKYRFDGDIPCICLWGDIRVTIKDIRSVQLAKGAALAAARLLLKEAGCMPEQVERVMIAGAFGENLNMENFRVLGLLPEFPAATWHFLGNSSLQSAQEACCNPRFHQDAAALRDRINELNLSQHEEFSREFVAALNFP
ncbi:MAG TPA: ASKHA domain-containing protein [Deltaproteobacteria bacterium]|nr:ASKHA domain-containing protein [Deltaproteobacteria bacterium]HPJ93307.1 ASKHA domain-containing protein [Deltaproteobacteria bacterium]HPR52061.1 ASKHA domain-containing protein [Deltaproteobacteria bacterium]